MDEEDFEDLQDDLCNDPLVVSAHRQAVVLLGPDGIALAMTASAAETSIIRLQEALAVVKRNAKTE